MWLRHVYVTFFKPQNLNQESCDCWRKSQMLTHIPLLLIEVIDVTWLFANWGEELSAMLIFPLWPLQVLFIQSTHCFSNPFREVWKIEIQRGCLSIFLQWLVWSRRCHMSASKSRPSLGSSMLGSARTPQCTEGYIPTSSCEQCTVMSYMHCTSCKAVHSNAK